MPVSNVPFWENRFAVNVARDQRVQAELVSIGWSVLVVWECQTRSSERLAAILQGFLGPAASSAEATARAMASANTHGNALPTISQARSK